MTLILDYWFLTPICLVGAAVATTVGIGGPVFFTPVFILVLDLPPATAVAVALFTQFFGFLSGSVAYWRRRLTDHALARRLIRVAVPAALVGSVLADLVPGPLLRRLFGCVAIAVAYRVFVSSRDGAKRPEHALSGDQGVSTTLTDRTGRTYRYTIAHKGEGAAVTTIGATLLGMISVGLAELQGYHLIVRSRVPPPVAVATTIAVVLPAVAAASVGHLYNLSRGDGAGGLAQVLPMLIFTIPGVLIGGQLGPYVQARLAPAAMKVVIAVVLLAVGGVMLSLS